MPALRLVLGDQLNASVSALRGTDRSRDVVVMFEVAEELRAEGFTVEYMELDDPRNTGSITAELGRAVTRDRAQRIVATKPGEWRVRRMMQSWETELGVLVEIREDNRFLCSHSEFEAWAEGKRQLRMESFYRGMRKRTGWLMEGEKPERGGWNFDAENRRGLPAAMFLASLEREGGA